MCLITDKKEPEITKEDLVVFKVIKIENAKRYFSMCHFFEWTPGKLETCELEKHSFSEYDYFHDYCDNIDGAYYRAMPIEDKEKLFSINKGFHAFLTIERLERGDWQNFPQENLFSIEKFLIPTGSEIYKDETGLVVSNQMMLIEK